MLCKYNRNALQIQSQCFASTVAMHCDSDYLWAVQKILIIQTAFIGDVVLATSLVEKMHVRFPGVIIDVMVRKGNEKLLLNNPAIHEVLIWNKKAGKWKSLMQMVKQMRSKGYDKVINLQRFFSTGLMTVLSGSKETRGYEKNPLSAGFSKKFPHIIDPRNPHHETVRINELVKDFTDDEVFRPRLYPSDADEQFVTTFINEPFVTITPSSVWFTKQYPLEKWADLIQQLPSHLRVFILGGKDNAEEALELTAKVTRRNVEVLAGKLSFLQSAALMKHAVMNYVNDSAPLHFA
ncbi:MAG: glycosyltransferase family 9 protein, partial [Chitinophagaceae bacterium]